MNIKIFRKHGFALFIILTLTGAAFVLSACATTSGNATPSGGGSSFSGGAGIQLENTVNGDFHGANFNDTNLNGLDFTGANLSGTMFNNAKLIGVNLSSANATGAFFTGADLTNAILNDGDFTGADFTGALLTGITYNSATKWPQGFDPAAGGAIPASTSTPTPIPPTPIPTLGVGSTSTSPNTGMELVYVPAGKFSMGSSAAEAQQQCQQFSTDCDVTWVTDESPQHEVTLPAFWIDKTEVTTGMYEKCVATGACKPPINTTSYTHHDYYGNPEFANYPVIYIYWKQAKVYCDWAGGRLPTEAEWEKAARGPDGNIFPWGNTFDPKKMNFCDANCSYNGNKQYDDGNADVAPVGSYPAGASAYGALDMAGNVWEWTSDWYDVYPGGDSTLSKDYGQTLRVMRGGSWFNSIEVARSAFRNGMDPIYVNFGIVGFRCAYDAPQ